MIDNYFIDTAINILNRYNEHQIKIDEYANIVKNLSKDMIDTSNNLMDIVSKHKKTTDKNELIKIGETFAAELTLLETRLKENEKERHFFENVLVELDKEYNILLDNIKQKYPNLSTEQIGNIIIEQKREREG